MSLDLDDLSEDELYFVTWLLRKCYLCEKEIPITETDNGFLQNCGCLHHIFGCRSPKIREYHRQSECSLDFKRTIIRGFLKNQDLSTAILQKLKDDYPNLLIHLDSTKNAHDTLNNKEIVLLIRIFRICFECGKTISDTNWYYNQSACGCIYHSSNCQSPQNRPSHPSCSYEYREQTVQMYKESINGNFGKTFRKHMTYNYPSLMIDIFTKNLEKSKKRLADVESEKDMLEHSLQLKKEESKQLNKEITQISLKFLNLKVYYTADLQKETYCGHGSNGVVNVMDNPNGQGKLAIKRYRAGEPNMSLRDKNEIFHLLEVCNHKNFIPILGVLYENEQSRLNNPFPIGFVMEYMDGGTLSSLIHDLEKKYENVDIFNWIGQASEGLYYLHTKKIIHRDVKPDNMMLTNKNQTLKLCDLGLSRIQGSSNSLGKGTACYMAPEMMKPEAEAIYDEKCDVYSLGVSMWEMVNREVPFKGVALFQISDRVLKKERPTIREDCDSTLRMLITRSWEHDPQSRLTMTEIHETSTERWRTETAAQ